MTGWLATLAIVLAKRRGLTVIADAPAEELERVRSVGADHVVERGDGVAGRIREIAPDGVDAVLDTALIGRPGSPAPTRPSRLPKRIAGRPPVVFAAAS